ncbi:MAG TPA: sigma 54-interacting transcriptional regulator [bacterium]|nr:sigma 54-interacting transcriptional regulator [bacterium]
MNDDLLKLLETNKALVALGQKQKMLDFTLDEAIRLSGAERGFVVFQDRAGGFEIAAARSFDREDLKKAHEKFSVTVLKRVMETGEPLLSMEAAEDARLKAAESVMKMKLRSILCVPILKAGVPLGALYLDNRFTEGAFQEHQVRLVTLFADQAALALAAIDSLETSERHARELEALQRQLAVANEALQDRLAATEGERDQARQTLEGFGAAPGAAAFSKGFEGMIGHSKAIREIQKTILRLKDAEPSVSIYGESGTGKELVARAIHRNSRRREKPFLAINCAAFSEQLLDSELFGHVRGAFTGADRDRRGLFEEADGGTVFLDEIGETTPAMQAKLLRVLQEGEIRPVGSSKSRKVGVRVVCASNKDLQKMVREGGFREDLYYRLVVVRMNLPPLRERREDIPDLVRHFLKNNALGLPPEFVSIDDGALKLLCDYDWPGNVRELQNELTRCLALGKGHVTAGLLSPEILSLPQEKGLILEGQGLEGNLKALEKRLVMKALEDAKGNKRQAAEALGVSRVTLYQKMRTHGLSGRHGRANAQTIRKALREAGGNKTLAARKLGMGRRTLYDRLKRPGGV